MQNTDNRTNGGRFEQDLAGKLSDAGWWVHVLQQNKAGHPADIIAAKDKFHTLIDCKVVSDHNGFPFSRVEENQRMAMKRFFRRAGELCYFAIKLPNNEIRFISMSRIETLESRGKKKLTEKELQYEARTLEDWLYYYDSRRD